jgi:hypothetical protein
VVARCSIEHLRACLLERGERDHCLQRPIVDLEPCMGEEAVTGAGDTESDGRFEIAQ